MAITGSRREKRRSKMLKSFFLLAYKNLTRRSIRSWITILGIVISVATILTLVIVSSSLENAIKEQFEKIGSNRIFVLAPGGQPGTGLGLTTDDVETIEKIGDIDYVLPYVFETSMEMEFGRETAFGPVMGWKTDDAEKYFADYDITLSDGRVFHRDEKYGVILGKVVAEDLFEKEIYVKNSLYINGTKFRVIGIMDDLGNEEDNKQSYIPLETMREITGNKDEVSFIDAIVKKGIDVDSTAERIERKLERKKGEDTFRVMKPEQILKLMGDILGIVQAILVSIALISLVVGAVGIMNIMFSAILERTKEIGIMKSVGAKNSSIMSLFMIESGLIGFFGGIFGVIIGIGVSYIVQIIAAQAGMSFFKIHITAVPIVGALVFSFLVGMAAGALPARRAALLHPVDALRWSK